MSKRPRTSPIETRSVTRQKVQKTPEENSKFFFDTMDVREIDSLNIASLNYILDSINNGDVYDLNFNVNGTTLLSCAARFISYAYFLDKNDKKQIVVEIVNKLLDMDKDHIMTGVENSHNETPLMFICYSEETDLAIKIIDTGYSNPNIQDVKGHTALTECCMNGMWAVGDKLLTIINNATIGLPDNEGLTALMHAVGFSVGNIEDLRKKEEFCLKLIETGHSNPNMKDHRGHTALTKCCINVMWTVAEKLLTVVNKETIGLPDIDGVTPLMDAIDSVSFTVDAHNAKDAFCVKLIETGHSNPSQIDNARQRTALILSIEYNTIKTSLKLLELANNGVDVAINANLKFIGNNTITTTAVHNLLLKIFTQLRTQQVDRKQATILREFIYYYLTHRDMNNPAEIHWVISEDIIKNICKEKIFANKLKNYLLEDKRIKDIPNVDWDSMCQVIPTVAKIKPSRINMQTATFTNESPVVADEANEIPVLQGINIPSIAYYVDVRDPDTGEMRQQPIYDRDLVDPTIPGRHIPRPKDPHYTGRWGGRTKKRIVNKNKRTKRNKQSKRTKRKTRKA
jgi:ankyrin repeat protein